MSDGRRTAKLKTQCDCTLCGDPRVRLRGVLMCPQCDHLPPSWVSK